MLVWHSRPRLCWSLNKCYFRSNSDRLVYNAVIIKKVFGFVHARWDLTQERPHDLGGVIQQLARRPLHALNSIARTQLCKASGAGMAGRELRPQIALALFRSAHVVQQELQHIALSFALAHEIHRGNAHAFLIDLTTESHRARERSAYVGVMSARRDEEIGRLLRSGLLASLSRTASSRRGATL